MKANVASKYDRHAKIIELIGEHEIQTQEELVEWLRKEKFDATQATVSRDIRELRLIKVMSENGVYQYATTAAGTVSDMDAKLQIIFSESVTTIEYAQNIVVVKTLPGMAQAAASAMDAMEHDGVIGCIAGDDTVMVVIRDTKDAQKLTAKLKRLVK